MVSNLLRSERPSQLRCALMKSFHWGPVRNLKHGLTTCDPSSAVVSDSDEHQGPTTYLRADCPKSARWCGVVRTFSRPRRWSNVATWTGPPWSTTGLRKLAVGHCICPCFGLCVAGEERKCGWPAHGFLHILVGIEFRRAVLYSFRSLRLLGPVPLSQTKGTVNDL